MISNFQRPYLLFGIATCWLLGLLAILMTNSSNAQESTEEDVKAAFIYNFIRYIEWPEESKKSSFKVFYYGDNNSQQIALRRLIGNSIRNIVINVSELKSLKNLPNMDVLFVDKSRVNELRQINALLTNRSVLLISSEAKDQQLFGINFNREADSRVGFELNRYHLVHQKLKVSSDIVILGGTEIDIATLVHELESNMERSLSQLAGVRKEVAEKQALLDKQQAQMDGQASQIKKQQIALKTLDKTIKSQQLAYDSLKNEYSAMKRSLETSRQELTKNNDLLGTKQAELEQKTAAIGDLAALIDRNKQLLIEQRAELDKQKSDLKASQATLIEQRGVLEQQSMTIKNQTLALYGSIVIILSVGLSIVLIYRGYKLKKQSNDKLELKNTELEEINFKLTSTQDQLVKAEKMAALGSLVAGVAHEINTPIGVGVTSASHLLDSITHFEKQYRSGELKRSELESLLEDLTESGQILSRNLSRASALIKSFKKVSADQTNEEIREFNLADYLDEVCQNLRHKLKQRRHSVKIECSTDLMVKSYPGALSQVITNLIVNSIIHGYGEEIAEGVIKINCNQDSDQIVIDYQDNGKGIPNEQVDKVFDPFFTTNRSAGGTGLGLHICFNLVSQKLGGTIRCLHSREGAHFQMSIPTDIS